jgi:hypothetical protein
MVASFVTSVAPSRLAARAIKRSCISGICGLGPPQEAGINHRECSGPPAGCPRESGRGPTRGRRSGRCDAQPPRLPAVEQLALSARGGSRGRLGGVRVDFKCRRHLVRSVTVHGVARAVFSAPREGDSPIFAAETVDHWARTPYVPRKLGQSPRERLRPIAAPVLDSPNPPA